ncbi:MAG: recombinase family protein [Actinomycetota bacterium]|nr:recombinase family protein [Actinomycetota bacterium]
MPETPRRAIVYARISRDRTGAGLGVERQAADCQALAERLGWVVVETISENDTSAYKGVRHEYRRLLAELEAGHADAVIAWHHDRLHRSPKELEHFIEVVERHGVAVHFVQSGEVDLGTPAGRMAARIVGAVARHESEHRSVRVKSAREQMARQGRWAGGQRPFGWNQDGTLNDAEARLVKAGVEMLLAGGSLRGIVRMFNASDLRTTRKGRDWDPLSVAEVLRRPRNAGTLIHQGREYGAGDWSVIVNPDELAAVVDILDRESRLTSPGNRPRWLGSMIYRCGLEGCGDTLVVGTSGQHRKPSYRCQSSIRSGGPRHVTRQAQVLDGWVTEMLIQQLEKPEAASLWLRKTPPSVDVAAVRRELAGIDRDRAELASRRGTGAITWGQFDTMNAELGHRQKDLEGRLAAVQRTHPVTHLVSSGDVRGSWKRYDLDQRREVLREVVTVTVLPAGRGRQPDGTYFDPSRIELHWH